MVCCAIALITSIALMGFIVVIPAVATPWSLWYAFNVIWGKLVHLSLECITISFFILWSGFFLLYSIAFNYFMAVTTAAGTPSIHLADSEEVTDEHHRQCKKCNFAKPGRTHHCSVCKSCVMRMDHHCPWLANCVGYRNYRYFVCFLIWVAVTTSYVALLCLPSVLSPGSVLFPSDDFTFSQALSRVFVMPSVYGQVKYMFTKRLEAEQQNSAGNLRGHVALAAGQPVDTAELEEPEGNRRRVLQAETMGSAVDEAKFRKGAEYIILSANSGSVDRDERRPLSTSRRLNSLNMIGSHQQYHGTTLLGRVQYSVVHWRDLLPAEEWTMFFCFMMCLGVCVGTSTLMWFHLFLSESRPATSLW